MATVEASVAAPAPRTRSRPRFYIAVALLMIVIALFGFWPQYFGRLLTGTALDAGSSHLLVHLHSSAFLGWLLILLGQSLLVHAGRTDVHRRLGPWLAGYGFAAAALGVLAGLVLAARRVTLGGDLDAAARFVSAPLLDMVMFAGFLAAAIHYRRQAEVHKRLMVLATYSFAFVGVFRALTRSPYMMANPLLADLVVLSPILLCIAYELATRRRVHVAWLIGLAVFAARLNRELLSDTDAWLSFARALLQPFL